MQAAQVYFGVDGAMLCWGCDALVHGAMRALLCHGYAQPPAAQGGRLRVDSGRISSGI
uniref:Uncharacterized protein n=1 Tax=Arundo donax TaxID=35708 RepID=A0A0A8ZSE8_ARUDO